MLLEFLSQSHPHDRLNSAVLLAIGECYSSCEANNSTHLVLRRNAASAICNAAIATNAAAMVRIHALVAAQSLPPSDGFALAEKILAGSNDDSIAEIGAWSQLPVVGVYMQTCRISILGKST